MAKKPQSAASKPPKSAANKKAPAKAEGKPATKVNTEAEEDAWQKARQHKPSAGGNFEPPEIPDGHYLVQVTGARVDRYKTGNKQGMKRMTFNYLVHGALEQDDDGEEDSYTLDTTHRGARLRSVDDFDSSREITEGRTPMDLLSERLQLMEIDPLPESIKEFPSLATRLGDPNDPDGKMFLVVNVKNTYKGPDPERNYKPDETLHYQAVYVSARWPKEQAEQFLEECGAAAG
jgi:hypothetical protein